MSPYQKTCVRNAWWIGSLFACCCLASGDLRGVMGGDDSLDDARERLVLMTSGRILTGRVSRNGGGYLVEQPNGRVQVPLDDVRFVVNDLREAYRKQRDSVVAPTPGTYIALANWSISHRLYDEARDELKKCLKVDPENDDARRLLQRLADTLRANLPLRASDPLPLKTVDGFVQPDVASLGGLSRESAMQFTSRVQPLLLNKCGNAACHGVASSHEFKLTLARVGGHGSRQNSERNLAETMRYIDQENVTRSRLLAVSQGAHGGKGTIFVGPAGTEQFRLLRAWARTVVEEKQAEARELENLPQVVSRKNKRKRVTQASATRTESAGTGRHERDHDSDDRDSDDEVLMHANHLEEPRELKPDPTDAAALALEPVDPFDPDLFNRRLRRP
jgi:hypothetical protein